MQQSRRIRQFFAHSLMLVPLFLLAGCADGRSSDSSTAPEDLRTFDVAEEAPRTTSKRSEWSVGGIVKGSTETTTSEPAAAPPPVEAAREEPRPQSGLLTAGDHDDLLNPELYADYAGRFLQAAGRELPFVDTRTRVAVKVLSASGTPVPFARVEVKRAGAPLRLVAAADGTASFFPKFDRVPAKTSIKVVSSAGATTRPLTLGKSRTVEVKLPGAARSVSAMDLALVVDTTGSMGDEMDYLQAELDSIVARLKRDAGNIDLRIGVILYRDEGDDYVVRSIPLTGDIRSIREQLSRQQANGGGDLPEAVDQAVAAADRMQWRPDAVKAMLLVADAPPHEESIGRTLAATERLRSHGVQIVPVAASGVEESAEYVMRTMAAMTQGRYIFLTDDSGIGNPHEEPDVACYVVTRLDQAIGRVLAGLVEGRRIEPTQNEVIRVVGDYDRGRCGKSRAADQS